jgi:hypothetical protein
MLRGDIAALRSDMEGSMATLVVLISEARWVGGWVGRCRLVLLTKRRRALVGTCEARAHVLVLAQPSRA